MLPAVLEERARVQPDDTAYTFLPTGDEPGERLTYGDLFEQVTALAGGLRARGLEGERVLLVQPPGPGFIVSLFGCFCAGAVAVPTSPADARQLRGRASRLEAIAEDAEAGLVLAPDGFAPEPGAFSGRLDGLEWVGLEQLATGTPSHLERVDPDAPALIQYTSGSTGIPRGVLLSHANLVYQAELVNEAYGGGPGATAVCWLPLFHDMGLGSGVLNPLYGGFPAYLMPPQAFVERPVRWLRAIDRFRGTISGGPNFAYELCLAKTTAEDRASLDLSSWHTAFNGAEPVRTDTLRRFSEAFRAAGFRETTFAPSYGLAEATCAVSCTLLGERSSFMTVDAAALKQRRVSSAGPGTDHPRDLVGSGPPLPEHTVRIVDPDTRTNCPPGRVGEIWVQSPCVGLGYWRRPDDTEATFEARLEDSDEGPFMRTGDLGFLHDGQLYIAGRLKDIIIVHGRNYFPHDIEWSVESSHPSLRPGCGAAVSISEDGGEQLVVIQEIRDRRDPELSLSGVVADIRRAVARDHGLPLDHVVLVPPHTVAKTSSGKVRRRECAEALQRGELSVVYSTRD